MFSEDQWVPLIREIDERLEPIAKRPVDIEDPAWAAKLRSASPVDEAGVRPAAEELLQKLVREYVRRRFCSRYHPSPVQEILVVRVGRYPSGTENHGGWISRAPSAFLNP